MYTAERMEGIRPYKGEIWREECHRCVEQWRDDAVNVRGDDSMGKVREGWQPLTAGLRFSAWESYCNYFESHSNIQNTSKVRLTSPGREAKALG